MKNKTLGFFMNIKQLGSYFNPKSPEHHAVSNFKQLKGWQKFLTAAITAISIPLLFGFGSVALFRVLTKSFSAKPLNLGESTSELHSSAAKTSKSSSSTFPSHSSAPQTDLNSQIAQWLSKAEECHTYSFNASTQALTQVEGFTWDPQTTIQPTDAAVEADQGFYIDLHEAKELILSFKGRHLFAYYESQEGLFGSCLNLDSLSVEPEELLSNAVDQTTLEFGIFFIRKNEQPEYSLT
jgi:hypothetical protein